jgi:tRNA A-37 threonylcarbamoyl transferase component Bud32
VDPTEPTLAPGRVDRYLLLAPLGEGGVGQVHAAVRAGTQQLVVLKQLRVELAESEVAQERLRREAEILGLLSHPGIARLLDAGYAGDQLYLVMEHITGATLAGLAALHLEEGRLVPYAVTLTLAVDFLAALAHAHRLVGPDGSPLGLVHRDLTPRNLMLERSGRGRIIDFGVAQAVMGRTETVPGTVVGTPRYLAPEQARGQRVDHRADLYTLAVVVYELLTAQRVTPRGDRGTILQAVLHHTPPPAHVVNPRLPRALSEVLARALQKDPERRFEDADALRLALLDAGGDWARAPQGRLHLFFDECFPGVQAGVEGLRARARAEGPRAGLPGVTFALFERAQAEAWVATRPEVVHPSPWGDPERVAAPTRTDLTHAAEAEPTRVDPVRQDDLLAADPVTVVTGATSPRAETPERLAGPRLPPRTPPDPALRPRRRRAPGGLQKLALGTAAAAALLAAYGLGRLQAPGPAEPAYRDGSAAPPGASLAAPPEARRPSEPAQSPAEGRAEVAVTAAPPAVEAVARPEPGEGEGPGAPPQAAEPTPTAATQAPTASEGPPEASQGSTAPVARPAGGPPDPASPRPAAPTRPEPTPAPERRPVPPRPAPAPAPPTEAPALAALRERAARLRSSPADRAAFLELMAGIEARARALPPAAAARIQAHLSAAERSFDPRELSAAVEALARAEAGP